MAITAQQIADRAGVLLHDPDHIRWPGSELLDWIGDGQREVVALNPAAKTKTEVRDLDAGARQTLPSDAIQLIDVARDGEGRAVRRVERRVLDERRPRWRQERPSSRVQHYAYDPRDPLSWWAYPPNDGNGSAEVIYAVAPSGPSSLPESIDLDDAYANALIDYVAYRALSKDAEWSTSSMAASYYERFQALVSRRAQLNGVTDGSS